MISIIIPVRGCPKGFSELVDSIRAQTYRDFELIVINDASSIKDSRKLSALHRTRMDFRLLHLCKNRGPAGARNVGVSETRGNALLFIDADCEIRHARWLEDVARTHAESPNAIIGFAIDGWGKSYAALCDRFCEWTNIPVRKSQQVSRGHLMTAHLLVPRKIWNELGGLDARLRTGEDTAFCFKAHIKSIPVHFHNGIEVRHHDRETWGAFLRNQYLLGLDRAGSRLYSLSKIPWYLGAPKLVRFLLVPPITVALTLKHTLAWIRGDLRVLLALPGIFLGMAALAVGVAVGRPSVSFSPSASR